MATQNAETPTPTFVDLPWHPMVRSFLRTGSPVWLIGNPGTGKSTFVRHFSLQHCGAPPCELQGDPRTDLMAFWGRYTTSGGEMRFLDGPLSRAIRTGGVFVLNDVGPVPIAALSTLLPLREPSTIENPVNHEVLTVPRRFRLILTSNPENYKCRSNLATLQALVDGSLPHQVPDVTEDTVKSMLRVHFPKAGRSNLEYAVARWREFAQPVGRKGEQIPMRLSFRAAHQLLAMLEDGVSRSLAVQAALVDKFFLDPEQHSSAQIRHSASGIAGPFGHGEGRA